MAAGNAVIRKTTTWQQNRTSFQLSAAWEKWDSARESITKKQWDAFKDTLKAYNSFVTVD